MHNYSSDITREQFEIIRGEFRDWKGLEKSYGGRRKGVRTQVYYAHPYHIVQENEEAMKMQID